MAITSEIIGKLGGAGATEIPISATGLSGSSTNHRLATVESSGRTLVVVDLNITNASSSATYQPRIYIGDTDYGKTGTGEVKIFEIVNTDIDIEVTTYSTTSGNRVDLHGHVYAVKL
ncbi:MAG: hypothetical protein HLX46_02740 [Corynebacterium sp.]|uniref:hypothetical protein n=1 Tax=Corynebacterium sp. TaxID=1720 RepID=UPI0017B7ECB9|nr:hypothetical protein [Corynebacterium sp.]NWO15767.1 hypothetical protein [Corynebacterium sp.]